jgi:hypothetical protein
MGVKPALLDTDGRGFYPQFSQGARDVENVLRMADFDGRADAVFLAGCGKLVNRILEIAGTDPAI